jgi:two-component system sensor histidine kinase BaeS
MIRALRNRLGLKLFLTYLAVILTAVVILASTTQVALPSAFRRHMIRMGIDQVMGGGMMGEHGGQGLGPAVQELYGGFRSGFNEALLWAVLAASAVALVVSLLFSRSVVMRLRAMAEASQRIAEGRYDERVRVAGGDELDQLAGSFNRMAEKLERTESMRRRLIGDVAHELRTPLTAIQGSMEGLIDGVLPEEPGTYQQIHEEAGRLARLVDDLQELSRVEAGAYKLDLRPVALDDLVQIVLKRLRRQFRAKGVSLASEIPEGLPLVLADADRVVQVLANLVGNALQYTPAGGEVLVTGAAAKGSLEIAVRDTGIGIPAGQLERVFDRFYRVDKSRSRQAGGGSGIGLTIARHLVEAHGGRIWARSDGEGQGSTFTFTLPIA